MTKVTPISDKPLLTDVPGWLHRLADDIEHRGDAGPPYVMIIIPHDDQENEWPHIILYGKEPGDLERSGLIAQAQAFMTINKVARAR